MDSNFVVAPLMGVRNPAVATLTFESPAVTTSLALKEDESSPRMPRCCCGVRPQGLGVRGLVGGHGGHRVTGIALAGGIGLGDRIDEQQDVPPAQRVLV